MNTNTVVTFTDFSAAAENAVTRAAQLAARLGVTLQLGYCGTAYGTQRAERLARLDMRSRQLARHWNIDVQQPPSDAVDFAQWLAPRGVSALIVADLATADSLRLKAAWGPGHTLLNQRTSPVLLVHREASRSCKTVLIAYNEHEHAVRLGRIAAQVTDAQTLELFDLCSVHSVGARPAPDESRLNHREWPPPAAAKAGAPHIRYSDHLSSRRNRVLFHGQSKDTVLPVLHQAQRATADLVVAMSPPSHLLERWLRRSFGQRLAHALGCDLLLYPMGQAHPSATDARRRLLTTMAPSTRRPLSSSWGCA